MSSGLLVAASSWQLDNCGMAISIEHIFENRKKRLQQLLEPRGTAPIISSATGLATAYIWQLAKGEGEKARRISDEHARAIERGAGKPEGWLDEPHDTWSEMVSPIHGHLLGEADDGTEYSLVGHAPFGVDPLDEMVRVDKVSGAQLSAGSGEVLWDLDEVEGSHAFRHDFMARNGLRADRCRVWQIRGESMEPHYRDGGIVLIDMSDREPRHGKVYALVGEDGLRIKQLRRTHSGWEMYSFNPDQNRYPPEPVEDDNVAIIGRVRWYAREDD